MPRDGQAKQIHLNGVPENDAAWHEAELEARAEAFAEGEPMGREAVELRASASVSRHNSEEDDHDNARWNEFVAEVGAIAEKYDYLGAYGVMVDADDNLPTGQYTE